MEPITLGFLVFAGYPLMRDAFTYWFEDTPVEKNCWVQIEEKPPTFTWLECQDKNGNYVLPANTNIMESKND